VFQKSQHPLVIDFIEERAYIRIQNPVNFSPLDSYRQCIQRIVLTFALPEAI